MSFRKEILHTLPAVLFFVVSFNLIVFSEDLMFKQHYFSNTYYLSATLAALFMGKLLLILNSFSFINLFPDKPLIYNISWKFVVYSFFILFFRVIENFIHALIQFKSFALAYEYLSMALSSSIFWAIQTWTALLFLIFIIANEFIQAIGKEKIKSLLFGR
ncbi:MAG: hypothetical protein HY939_05385 [Gammaproteobacteria bacterium]|nr:hypothetical protein [Gammaproteobacteria bacterium]